MLGAARGAIFERRAAAPGVGVVGYCWTAERFNVAVIASPFG